MFPVLLASMSSLTFFYNFQVVEMMRQRDVFDVDRVAVVGPRADLERAHLLVEREEFDVDRTQAFVDRRRLPHHQTVRVDCRLCHQLHCEVSVSAASQQTSTTILDNFRHKLKTFQRHSGPNLFASWLLPSVVIYARYEIQHTRPGLT